MRTSESRKQGAEQRITGKGNETEGRYRTGKTEQEKPGKADTEQEKHTVENTNKQKTTDCSQLNISTQRGEKQNKHH